MGKYAVFAENAKEEFTHIKKDITYQKALDLFDRAVFRFKSHPLPTRISLYVFIGEQRVLLKTVKKKGELSKWE